MKKKRNRKERVAIFFLTIFILGILTHTLWPFMPLAALTANAYIPVTGCKKDDLIYKRIQEYLDCLPEEMRKGAVSITIDEDPDRYADPDVLGICTVDRHIHIKRSTIEQHPSTIWHECAHAYHFYLLFTWSGFDSRWRAIQGAHYFIFGDEPIEDLAYWVQNCYLETTGKDDNGLVGSDFFRRSSFYASEEEILAFKARLALLREYHFINDEQARILKERFPRLFK